jgi:hypothetical protein
MNLENAPINDNRFNDEQTAELNKMLENPQIKDLAEKIGLEEGDFLEMFKDIYAYAVSNPDADVDVMSNKYANVDPRFINSIFHYVLGVEEAPEPIAGEGVMPIPKATGDDGPDSPSAAQSPEEDLPMAA